jgi:hypothetical protein
MRRVKRGGLGWCGARLAALLMALGASGCAASMVQEDFSQRFKCPMDDVQVTEGANGRFRASGCEESALYECSDTCRVANPERPKEVAIIAVQVREPPAESRAARVSTDDAGNSVALDVQLEQRTVLKLRAAPAKHGELAQLKLQHFRLNSSLAGCEIELMINGQRITLPKARDSAEGGQASLVVDLSRDQVRELGLAEQLAVRTCGRRFSLSSEQIMSVREFVARYEEELGWLGNAGQSSGGMLPPTGGWPAWQDLGKLPAADAADKALDAAAVFKQVSPSVLRVEAARAVGISQGSGVAVSATDMLTNCHVVQGAVKITIKHQKNAWVARLKASEPKTDRCVLSIEEPKLTPIRGVRRYQDLVVGEAVYTVGAPSGLDLSLSDGLLSGLREEGGQKFIQTTAPISPGSSGGPLFDAKGHLVGVTTLVLLGKARLNQSLNFAIPADAFWSQ